MPRTAKRAKVPAYHMYLVSGRRLSFIPSVECIVGWKYAKRSLLVWQIFCHFLITSCSREKRYQALPTLLYWKRRKAWWGLGTPHATNSLFLFISSLDLDKWINEPPSDSGEDMVDDASFFLAPSSTSVADFYSSRGHHSPASSRSSKRDEKEDEEELKKASFCSLLHLLS